MKKEEVVAYRVLHRDADVGESKVLHTNDTEEAIEWATSQDNISEEDVSLSPARTKQTRLLEDWDENGIPCSVSKHTLWSHTEGEYQGFEVMRKKIREWFMVEIGAIPPIDDFQPTEIIELKDCYLREEWLMVREDMITGRVPESLFEDTDIVTDDEKTGILETEASYVVEQLRLHYGNELIVR